MVDFSRAEGSKNHKASFDKTCNTIIETIQQTQTSYHSTWSELEVLRKDRAAIIESTIQLLKNNKVKLTKQLGRCKNPEINEELLKVINELPFEIKEEIQCNLIKINNRYEKVAELGRRLEELSATLASYRVLEADYDEEVVIDLTSVTKKVSNEELIAVDESLEKVIEVKKASQELSDDLDRTLQMLRKNEEPSEEVQSEKDVMSSIINDDDITYSNDDVLYDTDVMATVSEEIEDISTIDSNTDELNIDMYLNNTSNVFNEAEDEFILFTINDKLTLKEIANNVYGEEKFWKELYNYGTNKGKIDRKAAEFNLSVEEIVSASGYLENITLQFPVELVTIEEIPASEYEQSSRKLAA